MPKHKTQSCSPAARTDVAGRLQEKTNEHVQVSWRGCDKCRQYRSRAKKLERAHWSSPVIDLQHLCGPPENKTEFCALAFLKRLEFSITVQRSTTRLREAVK